MSVPIMPQLILLFCVALLAHSPLVYAADAAIENQSVEAAETAPSQAQRLGKEAETINAAIQKAADDIEVLGDEINRASGDRLGVLILERQKKTLEILHELFALAANLEQQSELGADTVELRDMVVSYLVRTSNALDRFLDREGANFAQLRSATDRLEGVELIEFEQNLAHTVRWLEDLVDAKIRTIEELEALDVNVDNHTENLTARLKNFGSNLAGQLQLVDGSLRAIKLGGGNDPLSAEMNARVEALNIRRASIISSLTRLVQMLSSMDVDTNEYRQLLLETGEITTDLFNPEIIARIVRKQLNQGMSWVANNTGAFFTQAVIFVLIIAIFRLIARFVNFMIRHSFDTKKVAASKLLESMLLNISSKGITFLGVLVALSQMGLEITALLTGLGIAGFIVGFALQDSLSNFVAGIMILGYEPFDVGDVIEAGGVFGKVSNMSMVSTTILTFDNQTLIVPNSKIWGDVIKNITLQGQRRIDLEFNVSFDEDVERVKAVLRGVVEQFDEILEEPNTTVEFNEMTAYSMVFVVRPWVNKEDYWPVRWKLMKTIRGALQEAGIEIPKVGQAIVTGP